MFRAAPSTPYYTFLRLITARLRTLRSGRRELLRQHTGRIAAPAIRERLCRVAPVRVFWPCPALSWGTHDWAIPLKRPPEFVVLPMGVARRERALQA